MDLREFLRVLRASWMLIAAVVLLGGIGAGLAAWSATPTYVSTTQFYLTAAGASSSLATEYTAGVTTAQRVGTYVHFVNSPVVANAVANQLGNPALAGTVASELTATNPTNTYVIAVTVKDSSAARAHRIAAAFDGVFNTAIRQIESHRPGGTSPFTLSLVQPATYSATPIAPNKKLDLALGLILGLVAGVAVALLRHALDRSIRSADELETEFDLPTLAIVGVDGSARRRPLIENGTAAQRSEAFRQLRTSLQFAGAGHAPRLLVVTSPATGEGKTTTAANLGLTLARAGARVLLIDADLRRPRLAQYFGFGPAAGLSNVLVGEVPIEDALQQYSRSGDTERLSVLASGPGVSNPSELLGSVAMSKLLSAAAASFDFVLLDAPPVLPVTDATVLAALCQGTVLVVKYGQTTREQLERALASLRQVAANITGAVLNQVPARAIGAKDRSYAYPRGPQLPYKSWPQPVAIGPNGSTAATASTGRSRRERTPATQDEDS